MCPYYESRWNQKEDLHMPPVYQRFQAEAHTHADFPRQHTTQSKHSYTRKPYRRTHHGAAARATTFYKQPTTLHQVPDLSQRTYGRTNVYCTAHVGNQPVTVDATNLSANIQPESSCSLQAKRPIIVGSDYTTHTAIVGIHRRRRRRDRN